VCVREFVCVCVCVRIRRCDVCVRVRMPVDVKHDPSCMMSLRWVDMCDAWLEICV